MEWPLLIDTHAHLDMLTPPVEEVLERARDAGVGAVVTVGESIASSEKAVALAERFDGSDGRPAVWATVGIHPHNARYWDDAAESRLRDLAAHPRVVAIGETGLDLHYDHSPRDAQRAAFEAQRRLAVESGLPLVVHDREAHEEVFALLAGGNAGPGAPADELLEAPPAVVLHCFSGDAEWAQRFLGLGCYLAFGGAVTFKRADAARAAVAATPLDRLLLETDCPYLSPEPFRGKENEPARVAITVDAVARAKGAALTDVGVATTANAVRALGLHLGP